MQLGQVAPGPCIQRAEPLSLIEMNATMFVHTHSFISCSRDELNGHRPCISQSSHHKFIHRWSDSQSTCTCTCTSTSHFTYMSTYRHTHARSRTCQSKCVHKAHARSPIQIIHHYLHWREREIDTHTHTHVPTHPCIHYTHPRFIYLHTHIHTCAYRLYLSSSSFLFFCFII